MKFLFIHQNFPGQFRHLAPALVAQGHSAIGLRVATPGAIEQVWRGVRVLPYRVLGRNTPGLHPWLLDMETKTLRAEACWHAMRALKVQGFTPDVVIAHPGWGEPMFTKQVWPQTKLGVYAELFYQADGADTGFDPEFLSEDPAADGCRLQMKNLNHLAHLDQADGALSPTRWQANTFPSSWRERICVAHDGIDTVELCPNANAFLKLPRSPKALTRNDEVITFVARHLEPYRGFHVFLRALPGLLRERPNAQVVIVGDEATGYGAAPPAGRTWKQVFLAEVASALTPDLLTRIHFLGRVERDVFTQMLQISRVHVYLSYPFVLSWSLIEAMSVGAAIVAGDTAPVREVVEHDANGLLVDFFDQKALVSSITRLLDHPDERKRLGEAARAHACRHYDLKSVCLPRQVEWATKLKAT